MIRLNVRMIGKKLAKNNAITALLQFMLIYMSLG